MLLNDAKCKNAKAQEKPYKLFDGGGLFLQVAKVGSVRGGKYWRFKYRFGGKEKLLAFGTYPELSLKDARDLREDARRLIAKGIDPGAVKQAEKLSQAGADAFETVAREWHGKHLGKWTEKHGATILVRLEQNVFPWLGRKPIDKITPPELLRVLQRMEQRGALETAHRVQSTCGQIFRYAVATGRAERDPTQDIRGALAPAQKQHLASITDPVKVGALLRAIDAYEGGNIVRCALKLAPLVFVRPGELRQAEWAEIDWQEKQWRLPAEKMKARKPHIVPLSRQALAVLEELKPLTSQGGAARYLFPSPRTLSRPMSDNAVLSALRRMGYSKEEMSGHGFRHMASTLLNEQQWNPDAIERQLAHGERNSVRAAYNYAEYLPERTKMMQAWADYLDELRAGGEVIQMKFGGE